MKICKNCSIAYEDGVKDCFVCKSSNFYLVLETNDFDEDNEELILTDKTEDRLSIMFDKQWELQDSKGIWTKINENDTNIQEYLNQNFLALHEEAVEIMRETAYKNPEYVKFGWKKNQQMNFEKAKDEIIDLWHFVMNISMVIGMDEEEFFKRYCIKNNINHERDNNGY